MSYQQPYQPAPPKQKTSAWKVTIGVLGGLILFSMLLLGGCAVLFSEAADEVDKSIKEETGKSQGEKLKKGQFGDGDHVVGEDIPAGTYETAGASSDVFDVCTITTEPKDSATMPQAKTANKDERIVITLSEKDGTVTIQGCKPLTPRK